MENAGACVTDASGSPDIATPELRRTRSSDRHPIADGACVEVAITDEGVAVRDTKDRSKAPHIYTHAEWTAFISGVKDGEFGLG
jgi:hypothetical protein